MKSRIDPEFLRSFYALSTATRKRAREVYRLWARDPRHPSLHFKELKGAATGVWSVRVGEYRALAVRDDEGGFVWFWIGTHRAYERWIRAAG